MKNYQQIPTSTLRFIVLGTVFLIPTSVSAQFTTPVAVPYSSGDPYQALYAELAIDGDLETFCVLFNDTTYDFKDTTTGHMIFDMGESLLIEGANLISRNYYKDYNPKDVDFFYFADDNPDNNTLVDDIENDSDIVLITSHSYPSLVDGSAESVSWDVLPNRRYIGMRINSSWEEGPINWNYQFAELQFAAEAEYHTPSAVPYSAGDPLDPASTFGAQAVTDGEQDTFCVLFDDTENNSEMPTTGHMVFDLGEVLSVGGVKLTSRDFDSDYNPKDVDFFYFADDNPDNNTLVDDIENDSDIVLITSHSYPGLVDGAAELVTFPSTLDRRYIGMRVNSSWEEGPTYWDYQIAEVEFFLDAGALAGDLNADGFVGGDDLDIVRSFWGQNVTAGNLLQGDPSNDGFVGGDDLDIVRANWGQGTPPGPASVPEPGAILLMLWLAATALVPMNMRLKRKKA